MHQLRCNVCLFLSMSVCIYFIHFDAMLRLIYINDHILNYISFFFSCSDFDFNGHPVAVVDWYFTTIHIAHAHFYLPAANPNIHTCVMRVEWYIRSDTIQFYPLIPCCLHAFNTNQNENGNNFFLASPWHCFNHSNLLFLYWRQPSLNGITWNHENRIHMSIKSTYNKTTILPPLP